MHFKSLALVAGAAIAAADSTVTLFLPGFDAQSIDAKILGSSKTMTTYLLNCPPGADVNDCGLPDVGYKVTAGGSTVLYTMSYEEESVSESCKLDGTTSATCWGAIASGTVTSTESSSFNIATIPYGGFQAVHVTATETGEASASTGASASASTATATTTTTTSASTTAESTTGSASQTTHTGTSAASTSASHSSNAAMPMMTGNALWVAGGAAAALALVAV